MVSLCAVSSESSRAAKWQFARAEARRDALVGAIVAFRMRIRHVTAKFKLSQNRAGADQRRIADALAAEPHADAAALAGWMRAYAAKPRE